MSGMKICTKCGEIKAVGEFRKDKRASNELSSWCKECAAEYDRVRYIAKKEEIKKRSEVWRKQNHSKRLEIQRQWRKKNPISCKKSTLRWQKKHRFNVILSNLRARAKRLRYELCIATPEELEVAFTEKCHICGVHEGDCNQRLAIDHCHKTGKFRGWLCNGCNRALGCVEDSPERLEAAAKYLRRENIT